MTDITQSRQVAATPDKVRGLPGHVTVGTNDLDAASVFYDKLLAVFGIGRVLVQPNRAIYYGHRTLEFGIIKPFDGSKVDEAHATALAAGGSDEGAPGPRGENGTGPYCAYFRDPEGNKFLIFRSGAGAA
ncbi:VOC family protein [Rhizobium leguminosarum]|uniref:VOC family protein n=1 Tax=Rhizobium leguminosarum TaxID=384 RepID=A0AAJ1AC08_RHILE|nr:VOC family protein [Rhizobium leguminosarum]MBY5531586.1 VOC family protein [Rhizobium leguminosarum]MBY5560625.1 VOC family protein [Rhizobium leguminosarum]MBY5592888.1 VOC family protein [Rhizobium leguminosarum]MBY5613968.1 VOC family protein [Rhizobium leguminosarum]MBY5630822.1 VOC family protein [Rhizobium leguminosarum]